ncbi:MAG TPA: MFS transporter [Candidatus Sulfotelmatobacter sp.]|nr:MFS transporter [Candidatus Sulfotelmatobacter sp.]
MTRAAPRWYYGWTIVAALGVTTIVAYGTTQYLIGLLVDPLVRELGWSRAAIGGAYSGTILVAGLVGIGIGRVLDRVGARLVLCAGSLVTGASLLALAQVRTLAQFQLVWALGLGVGTALTYYPVSFTVLANWFAARRVHALAVLTFFGAFSSTIFYPLSGLLIAAYGWRIAVTVLAAIHLCIALPLHATLVRRHPEDLGLVPDGRAHARDAGPQSGMALRAALTTPAFWSVTVALTLALGASSAVLVQHVAYLIDRGYAPAGAASLVGLFGVAYLPGRSLVAYAAGRVPRLQQMAIAFLLQAAGLAVLIASSATIAVLAYVLAFGAAYGALSPLRGEVIADLFGRRAYGAIIAVHGVPIALLGALGPLLVGRAVDRFGYPVAFGCCIAAFVCAAAIVVLPAHGYLRNRK